MLAPLVALSHGITPIYLRRGFLTYIDPQPDRGFNRTDPYGNREVLHPVCRELPKRGSSCTMTCWDESDETKIGGEMAHMAWGGVARKCLRGLARRPSTCISVLVVVSAWCTSRRITSCMRHGAEHDEYICVSKQQDRCLKRSAEVWAALCLLRTDGLPRDGCGTERAAYCCGPGASVESWSAVVFNLP